MLTVNVTPAPLLRRSRTAREAIQSALLAKPEKTADIQAKATTLGNAQSAMTVQQRALREAKINEVFTPSSTPLERSFDNVRATSSKPRAGTELRINQRCFWL
jgi:hypothetical protein